MNLLDDILCRLAGMDDASRAETVTKTLAETKDMIWVPNPGPQTVAFNSLADETYFGGQAGGGKDLCIHTQIPTPFGWKELGELIVGDQVIDESGRPCNIVAVSEVLNHECFEIEFSDRSKIVAGAGHQWLTSTVNERFRAYSQNDAWRQARRETRKKRGTGKRPDLAERNAGSHATMDLPFESVKTTRQIFQSVKCGPRVNHAVKIAKPLELPPADLLIDPYTLGAWLGDGTSKAASITGIDQEVFQNVANAGYTISRRATTITPGIGGLLWQLKALGLIGNKHIPSQYLRASTAQRLALLQGIMDTDGYCDTRGHCELSLTRKRLIDDALELILTLGIKARITEGVAKLNGRVIGPQYGIVFITDLPVFRLSRKLIRQKRSGFRGTHDQRYITNVRPCPSVPTRCIQVDSPSRMYLCGRSMIPTHNSDLGIGLGLTEHEKSLLLRRYNDDAKVLAERAMAITGTRDGYNGQMQIYRINGKLLEFGGCKDLEDRQRYKGDPHDLIVFDEIPDFLEAQYTFIIGWNRSANPDQRCRVVCTGNPPTTPEGLWVLKRWAAWLDPTHIKFGRVKDGDLLWYTTIDGVDTEVEGRGPHLIKGEQIYAKSRTFIRSKLSDNPDLSRTNYDAVLAGMPEELRAAYRDGKFDAGLKDKPFQLIPTSWVRDAQARWQERPPEGVPQCALGIDCTGGGIDPMVIVARHDGWYDRPVVIPGAEIPAHMAGRMSAGYVIAERQNNSIMIVDMGGGYGGPLYEHLKSNFDQVASIEPIVKPYKGSEGNNTRSRDGNLGFNNNRTAALWKFREALDPGQVGGSPIMLPPDNELLGDLTACTYEVKGGIIYAEKKVDVCARLGRSTNKGDAVVMAWTAGPIASTDGAIWDEERREMGSRGRRSGARQREAIMGRQNQRR